MHRPDRRLPGIFLLLAIAALLMIGACTVGQPERQSSTTAVAPSTTSTESGRTTSTSTPPEGLDLTTARWATHGPGGIQLSDGTTLLDTQPFPARIARDRQGGLVFTDSNGLWWLPAGEIEPELVTRAAGELITSLLTTTGPVAMMWDEGPAFYDLADGRTLGPPPIVPVEIDPRSGTQRWTAANGLTAWVTRPEMRVDTEGQPGEILEPARLVVANGDGALVDIEVGSVYETWATIHDFDGQTIILSRGPFEPAMPEETFAVIDLSTGGLTGSFIAGGTRATLTGADVDWAGPVHTPDLGFFTPVQMASDQGVASLDDGRHLVFIAGVGDDGVELSVDLAIWFGGNEANTAARLDGDPDVPVPNDYYIRNEDEATISVIVGDDVEVTSVWYDYSTDPDLENDPITYADFLDAMRSNVENDAAELRNSPWWVTIDGGEVTALDEQYRP